MSPLRIDPPPVSQCVANSVSYAAAFGLVAGNTGNRGIADRQIKQFRDRTQNGTPETGTVPMVAGDPTSSDWFAEVIERIQQEEYHITWQERSVIPDAPAGFQAPNQ